jgi:hypothetical protein
VVQVVVVRLTQAQVLAAVQQLARVLLAALGLKPTQQQAAAAALELQALMQSLRSVVLVVLVQTLIQLGRLQLELALVVFLLVAVAAHLAMERCRPTAEAVVGARALTMGLELD